VIRQLPITSHPVAREHSPQLAATMLIGAICHFSSPPPKPPDILPTCKHHSPQAITKFKFRSLARMVTAAAMESTETPLPGSTEIFRAFPCGTLCKSLITLCAISRDVSLGGTVVGAADGWKSSVATLECPIQFGREVLDQSLTRPETNLFSGTLLDSPA
jgi:hypothetical protein